MSAIMAVFIGAPFWAVSAAASDMRLCRMSQSARSVKFR